MFTSQTSSFQDSIDVDDRDDYDSEEMTGYSQKTQLNCYYTIYLYEGARYCSVLSILIYNSVSLLLFITPRINRRIIHTIFRNVKNKYIMPGFFLILPTYLTRDVAVCDPGTELM